MSRLAQITMHAKCIRRQWRLHRYARISFHALGILRALLPQP